MLEHAITFLQVKSIAPNSLSTAISDIGSVLSMTDRLAGSAPGNGSRAVVGEDLVAMTNCRLQVKNFMTQDGTNGTRKMKCYASSSETSDLESTATSRFKRPWVEVIHALLEETREMNQQLRQLLILVMKMLIQAQLLLLLKGVKESLSSALSLLCHSAQA